MSRYATVQETFQRDFCPANASHEAKMQGAERFATLFRQDLGLELNAEGRPTINPSKAKMTAGEWSLRGLAESLCGFQWCESLMSQQGQVFGRDRSAFEAGSALVPGNFPNVSAFLGSVTGLLDAAVLEGYETPGYIVDQLFTTESTKTRQRKLIGIGRHGDTSRKRNPGDPYPKTQLSERYSTTSETQQDADSLDVTFEAVYFDQTQEILRSANNLGESLVLRKELEGLSVFAGITNPYNYKGSTYNTFLTSGNWINDGNNELIDWANINVVNALFSRMTDQEQGLRVVVDWDTMVVSPSKKATADSILTATEVWANTQSDAVRTIGKNPVSPKRVLTSAYLDDLLTRAAAIGGLALTQTQADGYWWALKTGRNGAFVRSENWGLQINQASPNDYTMLSHKLLLSVFADQMHAFDVREPRHVIRNKKA